ncbi:hypothetical protein BU16DRAFT_505615 [Lophium mytilinum]|uniref:Uncharacterized protein n=1 Tax=Lophium mytilinum TaxID=390894 RepID=A0A6A6QXZ5_9PEZI|nr:hypothetical protein BU16DRAFT_505615 [Lophium mytilinum]
MTRYTAISVFLIYLFAFLVNVAAVPITPSAADVERLAERMRAEGVSEVNSTLLSSCLASTSFLFHLRHLQLAFRDTSGDLSPGSLEAPSMLPRSLNLSPSKRVGIMAGVFTRRRGGTERDFAYEGMEGRVRRPVGMRHWNWGARGYVFV